MNEYIFTFGSGHAHPNSFYAIVAEDEWKAREIMFDRFGRKWSMQYDSRESAGVDEYNLTEIK